MRKSARLVAAVQGDTLGVVLGRVRARSTPRPAREWLVRVMARRLEDNAAMAALVEALKPSNRRGLLRLVDAALWDARGDEQLGARRAVGALMTLAQLAGPDAPWREVRLVGEDLLDEDFAQVWRVGLRSGMGWRDAHVTARRLARSDVWEMAAALCRNVHIQDTQELEELCAVLVKERPTASSVRRMKRTIGRIALFSPLALVAPVLSWQEVGAYISQRDAVIASYQREFWRVPPAMGYSGDVDGCVAGSTSSEWQASVVQRVNWYRSMAGSPSVRLDTANHAAAMQAALIQAAAGRLSHAPGREWRCWTQEGADASAASDLALGTHGGSSVDAYIDDDDDDDTAVGHRWWLLRPELAAVAVGDVPGLGGFEANALSVAGNLEQGRAASAAYTAWPPAGFVPDAVVSKRWSFDPRTPGAEFAGASVAMTGPRGLVNVRVVHAAGRLVWEPAVALDVQTDTTYQVSISGGTGWAGSASYSVTVVPVNEPPRVMGAFGLDAPWCASTTTPVALAWVEDEGDVRFSLAPGEGATHNELFSMRDGSLYPAVELAAGAAVYEVRIRAQDSEGATTERPVRFSVSSPAEIGPACPVRNVRVEALSATAARVSWSAAAWVDPGATHTVYAVGGMPSCKRDSATSCVVTGLVRGATYRVFVLSRGGEQSAMSAIVEHTAGGPVSYRRGTSVKLALVMTVPAGTKTYRVSGRCTLSRDRKVVRFAATPGRCSITVTARTKRKGRTVVTSRMVQLRVS